jgi:hypothetical protein
LQGKLVTNREAIAGDANPRDKLGYRGDYSFEVFDSVTRLSGAAGRTALNLILSMTPFR